MSESPRRSMSRRDFLSSAATATIALTTADTLSARLPWSNPQAVHRAGDLEVLVVSDGHFFLPTEYLLTPDAQAADKDAVLKAAPPVGDRLQLTNNVAVIRHPSGVMLIDAGAGPRHQPTSGKLAENLTAAGIPAAAVTAVVLTHAHPDHLWGVLDASDNPIYPNALYMMSARERQVWSDPDLRSGLPSALANDRLVTGVRNHLARIHDKVKALRGGDEIIKGVRVIETPGHTPGHISLEVAGGGGLVIGGDALIHVAISFQYPSWRVPVDHEPDRGIATRRRLLDRLATDRVRLLGAHLPAPGVGYVERKDGAYRFVAAR